MNRDINVHMFIKHKETEHVHRMELRFKNYGEIDKFITELPETLQFIKYEKVSGFYRA